MYHTFAEKLNVRAVGTLAEALLVCAEPEIKSVSSTLMKNTLIIGDKTNRPDEALEINIQISKATSLVMPTTLKKFSKPARPKVTATSGDSQSQTLKSGDSQSQSSFNQSAPTAPHSTPLEIRTKYTIVTKDEDDTSEPATKLAPKRKVNNGGLDSDEEMPPPGAPVEHTKDEAKEEDEREKEEIVKSDLVKAYKYGQTWVPIEEGAGEDALPTIQGLEIVGFSYESLVGLCHMLFVLSLNTDALSPTSGLETGVWAKCTTSLAKKPIREPKLPSVPSSERCTNTLRRKWLTMVRRSKAKPSLHPLLPFVALFRGITAPRRWA